MKKLVCIGGGDIPRYKNGVKLPYETKEIDEEIVRLTNKENPKLLFIGVASVHPEEYLEGIKKVYEELGCTAFLLDISKPYEELEKELLSADIIYVGGGNTSHLIEQLKITGIDKMLIQAYNQGIVCAGWSAGSYCWFKYTYNLIEGMSVINAVNCVHYEQKDEASKEKFYDVVREKGLIGYAIDNQVAIEFLDDEVKIIKSNNERNAFKIVYRDGEFAEELLQ